MLSVEGQRLGKQLALRGEVAVDRTGGDSCGLGNHRYLSAAEADLTHDLTDRLQNPVAFVLKPFLDTFGAPIDHEMNPGSLAQLMNQGSAFVNEYTEQTLRRDGATGPRSPGRVLMPLTDLD